MTYLVDTNVLSEATRPKPDGRVVSWLTANESELCVSPSVLGEIEYGILLLAAGRRKRQLEGWFNTLVQTVKVIEFTLADGAAWARLLLSLRKRGLPMPLADSLLAASALSRGLTVATRNERHFQQASLSVVNPFRP